MNDCISARIKAISFVAIVAVIWWHCECGSKIERIVIPWLTHWSVPWFFIVSGAFYGESIQKYGALDLVCRKIQSLVLPYLIWCVIGWILWHPQIEGDCFSVIQAVLGLGGDIFPAANWPLWYLRSLIVFVTTFGIVWHALSLILHMIKTNNNIVMPLAAFLWGVSFLVVRKFGVSVSPASSIVYFSLGLLYSRFLYHEVSIRQGRRLGALAMVVSMALRLMPEVLHLQVGVPLMLNVSILVFIMAIWLLLSEFDIRNLFLGRGVVLCASVAPFVYFSHGPIIRGFFSVVCGNANGACVGENPEILYLAQMFFVPVVLFSFALALRRVAPRFSTMLSGGR